MISSDPQINRLPQWAHESPTVLYASGPTSHPRGYHTRKLGIWDQLSWYLLSTVVGIFN